MGLFPDIMSLNIYNRNGIKHFVYHDYVCSTEAKYFSIYSMFILFSSLFDLFFVSKAKEWKKGINISVSTCLFSPPSPVCLLIVDGCWFRELRVAHSGESHYSQSVSC